MSYKKENEKTIFYKRNFMKIIVSHLAENGGEIDLSQSGLMYGPYKVTLISRWYDTDYCTLTYFNQWGREFSVQLNACDLDLILDTYIAIFRTLFVDKITDNIVKSKINSIC